MEECKTSNRLFVEEIPVWYGINGKVSPIWLFACEEERNQTSRLMEKIIEPINLIKASKQVVRNAGNGGIDGIGVKELQGWLSENLKTLQESILTNQYQPVPTRSSTKRTNSKTTRRISTIRYPHSKRSLGTTGNEPNTESDLRSQIQPLQLRFSPQMQRPPSLKTGK